MYDAERATPAAYRDAQPERFAYVHFAAHATANRDSPLDSAVILSGSDATYKLYARDVAALPLSADLVTVSACRSAGERAYSGEGLVGFAWAFLRAGARRVVAGLWDVDDRSTADLMEHLYAGVTRGERPSAALRSAKLALIRQGGGLARPFAWGAFQLFTVVSSRTASAKCLKALGVFQSRHSMTFRHIRSPQSAENKAVGARKGSIIPGAVSSRSGGRPGMKRFVIAAVGVAALGAAVGAQTSATKRAPSPARPAAAARTQSRHAGTGSRPRQAVLRRLSQRKGQGGRSVTRGVRRDEGRRGR